MQQFRRYDPNTDLTDHARKVLRYLEQVLWLKEDIENLRRRIGEIEADVVSLASPSDYTGAKIQATLRRAARFESPVSEKDLLEQELEELTAQFEPLTVQAFRLLITQTDQIHRTVLNWHFFYGYPWTVVAKRVNRTERHVYRLRNEALEMITLPEDAIWLE